MSALPGDRCRVLNTNRFSADGNAMGSYQPKTRLWSAMPYLRDLSLVCPDFDKEERRRFKNEARSVCSLVTRLLPKTKTKRYKKVLVRCTRVLTEGAAPVVHQLGVAFVEIPRDGRELFALSETEKRRWAFEALREGVLKVAIHEGMDIQLIESAFVRAESVNLQNVWRWRTTAIATMID